jgi:RimJ/RimL family protein N-acetyltransferase
MLMSGRGSIVEAPPPDPPTMVSAPSVMLAVAFRWDCRDALFRALGKVPREFSIVAPLDAESIVAAALPRREREEATLFHLPPGDAARLPVAGGGARLLDEREYAQLDNLPPILRGELREASRYSPIAVAFAEDRPVSFCYSGWETESHWDVSIDTVESYRRRGLGTAACIFLIRYFAARGKTAVWGALESNPASTALAEKLGFTPVDRLLVAYPDRAHSGGG